MSAVVNHEPVSDLQGLYSKACVKLCLNVGSMFPWLVVYYIPTKFFFSNTFVTTFYILWQSRLLY